MIKKTLLVFVILFGSFFVFAESFVNNEYQKLAVEYQEKAQTAFDEGDYELSVEYSALATENATLSAAYIRLMVQKAEADRKIRHASRRLLWAESVNAPFTYPLAYSAAEEAYNTGLSVYDDEDYVGAANYAQAAIDALLDVKEVVPLPQYYVVLPWAETKDCFWNISARRYVYGDPRLWENLYQANKTNIPNPSNPDLIHPGMKMLIPSIAGEMREGVYSPDTRYADFTR
jgi:nucleoid-associated protein YgaU